jgi:excisionase family DNA binding protein
MSSYFRRFLHMEEKKLMSVGQVAEYLGVHEQTVRRWVHLGELPAAKTGRQFRIDPEDVERFAAPTIRKVQARGPIRKTGMHDRRMLVDGRKLKQARNEASITVRELSRQSGISESRIYSIQRAPRRGIHVTGETLSALAEVLGVDPKELIREE